MRLLTDGTSAERDDWYDKIRTSPRVAGVILIGLCQLVRLKFEVFGKLDALLHDSVGTTESRVKEIFISVSRCLGLECRVSFLQLLEGQMKLVVPAAMAHAEEYGDDDKSVRVRRRRPPGQAAEEEEVTEPCMVEEDEEDVAQERRPKLRKMPVVDMSWLQRPGMQEQMLEIQDMLNSMSAPSSGESISVNSRRFPRNERSPIVI